MMERQWTSDKDGKLSMEEMGDVTEKMIRKLDNRQETVR